MALPTDIAGCKLWLDANDPATLTATKGQQRQWLDKSGLGNHPVFRVGRPGLLWANPTDSSKRVVRLLEGSQVANSANTGWIRTDAIAPFLGSNFTLAIVTTYPKETADNVIFGAGNSANANTLLRFGLGPSTGAPRLRLVSDDGATAVSVQQGAGVAPELALFVFIKTGSNYVIRRNGVQVATGTFAGTQTFDVAGFGVRPSNGVDLEGTGIVIADVTLHDSALAGTDLTNLETHMLLNVVAVPNRYLHPTSNGGFLDARKQKLYLVTKIASGSPSIAPTYGCTYSSITLGSATGLVTYWADKWTGNDTTGDGSFANPFATGNKASSMSDVDVVDFFPGVQSWTGAYTRSDRPVQYQCSQGRAVIENAEPVPAAWTKTGGQTNVYEYTLTGVVAEVYDLTNELPLSFEPINLTLVGSIAAVDATPSSYFVSAGVMYVRTFDSRQADRDIVVRIGTVTPQLNFTTSGRFLSLENITLGKGLSTFPQIANLVVFLKNVRGYGGNEWGFGTNTVDGYAENCQVVHNSDGLDYRQTCTFLTLNCYYQSRATDFAANAETAHNSACIVSVNSEYVGGNRTHHSINGALVWLMHPIVRDSILVVSGASPGKVGLAMGDIDTNTAQTAKMWVEWPLLSGHATDLIVANGCFIECRGLNPASVTKSVLSGGTLTFLDVPPGAFVGEVFEPARRRRRAAIQAM